ncbi:MAG: hypothetical protein AMXMBFR82_03170 [Candidatus Hydrogenedentota bacterium]
MKKSKPKPTGWKNVTPDLTFDTPDGTLFVVGGVSSASIEARLSKIERSARTVLDQVPEPRLPKNPTQRQIDSLQGVQGMRIAAQAALHQIVILRHYIKAGDIANAINCALMLGRVEQTINAYADAPDTRKGRRAHEEQQGREAEKRNTLSPRDQFIKDTARAFKASRENASQSAVADHVLRKINEHRLRDSWPTVGKRQVLRIIKETS